MSTRSTVTVSVSTVWEKGGVAGHRVHEEFFGHFHRPADGSELRSRIGSALRSRSHLVLMKVLRVFARACASIPHHRFFSCVTRPTLVVDIMSDVERDGAAR